VRGRGTEREGERESGTEREREGMSERVRERDRERVGQRGNEGEGQRERGSLYKENLPSASCIFPYAQCYIWGGGFPFPGDRVRSCSDGIFFFLDDNPIRKHVFLFKTQSFGDWILSPSSGGNYSVVYYIVASCCTVLFSKF
jgi:hypothetical protein